MFTYSNGVAVPVNQQVMDSDTVIKLLYEVLSPKQIKEYEDTLEFNGAFTLEPFGSFRISAFRQKGSPAVVVRYIPGDIPAFDSLGLPIGLQFVGRPFEEETILRLGDAAELTDVPAPEGFR